MDENPTQGYSNSMKDQKKDALDELKPYGHSDITYNEYLKVSDLLNLQEVVSTPPHHDELLFIIIHQSYELWFKLILHELETAKEHMQNAEVLKAHHFLKRCGEILKQLVQQIHILETMTPRDFLEFRTKLNPASGFQSIQFREIEFMAGLQETRYLRFFEDKPAQKAKLEARLKEDSLNDIYFKMLKKLGFKVPSNVKEDYLEQHPEEKNIALQTLKEIYIDPHRNMPLYILTEALIDFDEYLGLWRDHHVRVVERIIGFKIGTGGSSGAQYLKSTTRKQSFPLLWQVRTEL